MTSAMYATFTEWLTLCFADNDNHDIVFVLELRDVGVKQVEEGVFL